MKLRTLFISIAVLVQTVSCEKEGSLTFVIDDSGSMQDDIDIVKEGVDQIMDVVLKKKSSQIKNIVLVRFNDPGYNMLTITKDRYELKRVLNTIKAKGGEDCPEMALHGIRLALHRSEANSYLFVFTDASPKDHYLTDEVITLARKKSSQVVFIISSERSCREISFDSYYKIAYATFGHVFRIHQKRDVKQILGYITETSSGEKSVLTQETIPANKRKSVAFNIDDQTEYAIVSTSGTNVDLNLSEISYRKVHYQKVTWLQNVKVVKLINPRPGKYSVTVESRSETYVIVFGRTDFKFNYGFSVTPVTSLVNTKKSPTEGKKHQLAISVTDPGNAVWINSTQILDMNENVIVALPLSKKSKNFYTTNLFLPPISTFLIAVIGEGKLSHIPVRRISKTPIQPQLRHFKPTVNIDKIKDSYEYNSKVYLVCKVKGYPKPKIEWTNENGNILKNAVIQKIPPYDYNRNVTVDRIKKSQKYICDAENQHGKGRKYVYVNVISPFIVKKVLNDTTYVAYEKDIELNCDIKSIWPMKITWFRNNKPINTHISKDGTKLTIKNVVLEDQGTYLCKAELIEDGLSTTFKTDLKITGLKPTLIIDKIEDSYEYNSKVYLGCKVKGYPKPKIEWTNENGNILKNAVIQENPPYYNSYVTIDRIKKSQKYICYTENQHGNYRKHVNVNVISPFIVKKVLNDTTYVAYEKEIELNCDIKSLWPMKITWFRNNKPINTHISKDGTKLTIKNVVLEDQGTYLCKAELIEDGLSTTFKTDLKITGLKPTLIIDKIEDSYEYNSKVYLGCKVKGYPKPKIEWTNENGNILKNAVIQENPPYYNSYVTIDRIKKSQKYICYTENQHGNYRKHVNVNVISPFIVKKVLNDTTYVAYEKEIELNCDIKSIWPMKITWFRNNKPINTHISKDGTKLTIKNVVLEDQGTYLCKAELIEDGLSTTFKTDVKITGLMKPRIEKQNAVLNIKEAKTVTLTCKITEGHPAPKRIWEFKEIHSDKWTTLPNSEEQLTIERTQLSSGHYKCVARNVIGHDEMDVNLIVETPPQIISSDAIVYAVELDLVLRIPCDTIGYPKPTIVWRLNDSAIEIGEKYNLDKETLVIHNPVLNDTGNYTCEVRNQFGSDSKTIEAIVTNDFPLINKPSVLDTTTSALQTNILKYTTKYVLEGNTINLYCPHAKEDSVRWYKDNKYLNITKSYLVIENANLNNDGTYACRVCNYYGTTFYSFSVDVGYGPRGKTESETINKEGKREDEKLSDLYCNFDMKPKTNNIEWTFNGETINELNDNFGADISWGNYTCKVTNPHGSAQKTFHVVSYDCLIEKVDNITNLPIILTGSSTWLQDKFYRNENYLRIPRDENLKLFCHNHEGMPNHFKELSINDEINATCIEENKFFVNNIIVKFEDLKCESPVWPVINGTKASCFNKNTELNKVGFQVDQFVEVFDVCVDQTKMVPLYARIDMIPVNNLKKTKDAIARAYEINGDKCGEKSNCCFGKTQLVNEQDVRYGPSQAATLIEMNFVPYWRPCSGKLGWNSIEENVRQELQKRLTQFTVWSGASRYTSKDDLMIPRYLWKVVKFAEHYAFSIVYVNDPTPVAEDKLCKDICSKFTWVTSSESIYCCELNEFRKAFDIPEDMFV